MRESTKANYKIKVHKTKLLYKEVIEVTLRTKGNFKKFTLAITIYSF